MVINYFLRFDLSSILPPNNGASLSPDLLQYNCSFSSNSKFHNSPAFTTQLHSTSSEDAPRSRSGGSSGLSSTALEKEANSNHGRKWGGRRGGGGRGINKSGHIMYKGVRKRKGGRWVAEIREPGKKSRIWLGTFATAEMAATAYDVAAFNLKTACAYLNFPQHVSALPILSSRSPKRIQEAASAVASSTPLATTTHIRRAGGLVATPTPHVHHTSTSLATEKRAFAFEEDMIFDMPNVLADMAHALMIPPPLHYLATPANAHNNNIVGWDCDEQFSLWNF